MNFSVENWCVDLFVLYQGVWNRGSDNAGGGARPSGTEQIYKIYAESFESEAHLMQILAEAQGMVDERIGDG
ncbi:hypothetical protein [Dyadobacter frigoris]|uniref:Uncharacterized protein n=1 Tax=Dyadobacter frigoris TaxID=2576211 RepID=A0A4U6CU40_9BACT|nr:hypothetical protein [Dyadobacter frigoris]TKT86538.1 hypothetical protein FDK13_32175 [Dyadobacter frigoris]